MINEISYIISQLIDKYKPDKIILFGSMAKGTAGEHSDIDLCIIAETTNKRKLLTNMYFDIVSEKPIDFVLYTPNEWESCIRDKTSFAYKLNNEGILLYG